MNTNRREIALINQIGCKRSVTIDSVQHNDNEPFVISPLSLFTLVDWTKFEEDVEVLNVIYSMLFGKFVIARKKLICYWPSAPLMDETKIKLGEYCRSARIEIGY